MATVHPEPSSGVIESSSARPPTPPDDCKESTASVEVVSTGDADTQSSAQSRPPASTGASDIPPIVPQSSASAPPNSSGATSTTTEPRTLSTPPRINSPRTPGGDQSKRRIPKSVVFSGKAHYQEAPTYDSEFRPSPSLLPSRTLKALKGILKASPLPIRIEHLGSSSVGLAVMLDSAIKQLSGTDKTSRIEAYSTLYRALKASNNLPDRVALNEKMGIMLKFLQRDIKTPPSRDPTDHSLVINALLMFLTFLYFPSISATIPADFGIFIIDHCIKSFEDRKLGKEVIRNLMQVVFSQNFPARVMSSERLRKLIIALHNLEQHIGSSKILIFRARIYKRLIKQCRPHMIAHPDWMPDLFTDMLSTVKEVRYAAMDLGYEAALSLGMEKDITLRVLQLLSSQETERDRTYLDFYIEKLSAQFSKKPVATLGTESETGEVGEDNKLRDMAMVSKIWTIVMLFIRSRPLDRWEALPKWLNLIPPCFNSSDLQCRVEANIAWSRFIYVAHLQEVYFGRILSQAIVKAYISQLLRRQFARKSETEYRKSVLGGVCSVYYYAFGGNTPTKLLDKYWDYTLPLFTAMTSSEAHPESRVCAVAIMSSLLDASNSRLWDEELVLGSTPYPTPEQVPSLDPRWIRRNLTRIRQVLQPVIDSDILQLSDTTSPTNQLCRSLSTTLCGLAAKEIKVSNETLDYASSVLVTVDHLWRRGVPESSQGHNGAVSAFLNGIRFYIMLAIDGLGLLPLMEPITAEGQNALAVFNTPSRRSSLQESWGNRLEILLSTLSVLPKGVDDGADYAEFLETVFKPFLSEKNTLAVSSMLQTRLADMTGPTIPAGVWMLAVRAIEPTLDTKASTNGRLHQLNSEVPLGREYKNMTRVLELGLKKCPNLRWAEWERLFKPLAKHTCEFSGSTGLAIVLLEPLAKHIHGQLVDNQNAPPLNTLMAVLMVLRNAIQPPDSFTVENAQRRLWGAPGSKTASFDPFNSLYALLNVVLQRSYSQYTLFNQEQFVDALLRDLDAFFERCSVPLIINALGLLQPGLAEWICDGDNRLDGQIYDMVKSLVLRVCAIISRTGPSHLSLESLEPLLCGGFKSAHPEFVNLFVTMWNRLYENEANLSYPQQLKDTLVNLQSSVNIIAPGLEHLGDSTLGSFRESLTQSFDNNDNSVMMVDSVLPSNSNSRPPSCRSNKSMTGVADVIVSAPTRTTRSRTNSRSNSRPNTPLKGTAASSRVRHDDSQVDFVPIMRMDGDEAPQTAESQILTDRQKEVRERQRGNNNFIPPTLRPTLDENQTVVEKSSKCDEVPNTPVVEEREAPSTPKTNRSFENYLSSTPTPVRTSKANLLDQDMSDVPSSPLDETSVRRYPLIPDIHNRSDAHLKEDWPEFSSPVNSSPVQPVRLTRSQKRATENLLRSSQDEEMTDADSPPIDGLLSSSIPSSLFDLANMKTYPDNEDGGDVTAKASSRHQRVRSSARKSTSQMPALTMTTRSASRSQPNVNVGGASSTTSSPLKRVSHLVDDESEDNTQSTEESQLETTEVLCTTQDRKRRRRLSVAETPQAATATGERTLRHRSIPLEAISTPAKRRSKRKSSTSAEKVTENASTTNEAAASSGELEQEDEEVVETDVEIPATPASAIRVHDAGNTPGPYASQEMDDNEGTPTPRSNGKKKRKRGGNRASSRKRKRMAANGDNMDASWNSSQPSSEKSSQESESSQELDADTQVSLDSIILCDYEESVLEIIGKTLVEEEPKVPSSPLSDLPDNDLTPVPASTIPPTPSTPTPKAHQQSSINKTAGVTISDEEAESQVLSELAASQGGPRPSGRGQIDPDIEETKPSIQDKMDIDASESLASSQTNAPTSTEAVVAAALKAEEEIGNMGGFMSVSTSAQVALANSSQSVGSAGEAFSQAKANPAPSSIMGMLRNGLNSLRQMRLSRQDMHQIEDLFVDFKRELYDAERRGRD
ncbi:hypothetical protein BROUX41_000749 [Berkeleyomyces rouxiae]